MQWKPSGGWISLLACSAYKLIREKYNDLLKQHDMYVADSHVHQEGWPHIVHYFHVESLYCIVTPLVRSRRQNDMFIWLRERKFGLFVRGQYKMGSNLGYCEGVTINLAIAICHVIRPRPRKPQSHQPYHRQIKTIIPAVTSASLTSETSPFLINLC